jgi:hypothetical protein
MTELIVLSSDDLKTLERGGVLEWNGNKDIRLIFGESIEEGVERYQKLAESEGVNENS